MKTVIRAGSQEIRGLGGILTQEGDGILNWMLEGLRQYRLIGLSEPEAILMDVESYRSDTDTVASWLNYALLEGAYVLDSDGLLQVSDVYDRYSTYCQDNAVTKYGKQRFIKKLSSLPHGLAMETRTGQRVVTGLAQAKRGI
jgi:phage/plasmid-associated DNA primase